MDRKNKVKITISLVCEIAVAIRFLIALFDGPKSFSLAIKLGLMIILMVVSFGATVVKLLDRKISQYAVFEKLSASVGDYYKEPIRRIKKDWEGVILHKKQNKKRKSKNVQAAYNTIYDQIVDHIVFATANIQNYIDSHGMSNDRESLLNTLNDEADTIDNLMKKLSELDKLYLNMSLDLEKDNTTDLDDLIESLNEMAEK